MTPDKLATGAQKMRTNNSGTTTSTSFTPTLSGSPGTNPSVTVDIGDNGIAIVTISAQLSNGAANTAARMGFSLSGANTVAASSNQCLLQADNNATGPIQASLATVLTGLNPGSTVFTLEYQVTSNTGTFLNREIAVVPL